MSRKKGQILSSFGKNLVRILEMRDLSQVDLANKMKLTRQQINNYVKSVNEPPLAILMQISKELDVSLSELLLTPEEINAEKKIQRTVIDDIRGNKWIDRIEELEKEITELRVERDAWQREASRYMGEAKKYIDKTMELQVKNEELRYKSKLDDNIIQDQRLKLTQAHQEIDSLNLRLKKYGS